MVVGPTNAVCGINFWRLGGVLCKGILFYKVLRDNQRLARYFNIWKIIGWGLTLECHLTQNSRSFDFDYNLSYPLIKVKKLTKNPIIFLPLLAEILKEKKEEKLQLSSSNLAWILSFHFNLAKYSTKGVIQGRLRALMEWFGRKKHLVSISS